MEGLIAGIPVLGVLGIIAGGLVALGIIWRAIRAVWRFLRRIGEFLDDWRGEVTRPGVPARPGVMARLEQVEQHQARTDERMSYVDEQLRPNGGGSLYDKITRVDERNA